MALENTFEKSKARRCLNQTRKNQRNCNIATCRWTLESTNCAAVLCASSKYPSASLRPSISYLNSREHPRWVPGCDLAAILKSVSEESRCAFSSALSRSFLHVRHQSTPYFQIQTRRRFGNPAPPKQISPTHHSGVSRRSESSTYIVWFAMGLPTSNSHGIDVHFVLSL